MDSVHEDPGLALRRTLLPCPGCGAVILTKVWRMGTQGQAGEWRTLWPPEEPLGTLHDAPRCAARAGTCVQDSQVATS